MKLRPYQIDLVEAVRAAYSAHRAVLLQLPTGGGKTVIASDIGRRLHRRQRHAVVLVHRHELIEQFEETLAMAGLGDEVGVIASGRAPKPQALFQIASVMTLIRRMERLPKADIVVIDEARHAKADSWMKILNAYRSAKWLGLDATPARLDGRGLGDLFDHLICGPTIAELQALGALCPSQVLDCPSGIETKGIRQNAGDFAKGQLARAATVQVAHHNANAIIQFAAERKALFFGISRAHAELVCSLLRQRGHAAAYVDGDSPKRHRKDALHDFRYGRLKTLCNVELFTEGMDAPACDCVVMARPTLSPTIFLQMIGRALRPAENKTALIIDAAGNIPRHGLPQDERIWMLDKGLVRSEETRIARPRPCNNSACRQFWKPPAIAKIRKNLGAEQGESPTNMLSPKALTAIYNQIALIRSTCPACGHVAQGSDGEERTYLQNELRGRARQPPLRPQRSIMSSAFRAAWLTIGEGGSLDDAKASIARVGQNAGYRPNWTHHAFRLWRISYERSAAKKRSSGGIWKTG